MLWLLLLTRPAPAWDTSGVPAWSEALAFDVSDRDVGLTPDDTLAAADAAAAAWTDVACADLELGIEGLRPVPAAQENDANEVIFEALEAGTLLAVTFYGGAVVHPDGSVTTEITEVDLGLQTDGVTWLDDASAGADDCKGEAYSLQAVMTHAIGHAAGLAVTDHPGAAMAQLQPCDVTSSTLSDDDRVGLQALYGAIATPVCRVGSDEDLRGGVPLTVTCDTIPDGGDPDFETMWSTDGLSSTAPMFDVTFEEAGWHVIEGCATATLEPRCAPHCIRFDALACDRPDPAIGVRRDGELTTLLNDTPVAVEGCATDVRWEIFDAAGQPWAVRDEWEPTLRLPAGDWSAILTVTGPGGTASAELGWTTRTCGCSSLRQPLRGYGSAAAWLLVALVAVRLREPAWARSRPG